MRASVSPKVFHFSSSPQFDDSNSNSESDSDSDSDFDSGAASTAATAVAAAYAAAAADDDDCISQDARHVRQTFVVPIVAGEERSARRSTRPRGAAIDRPPRAADRARGATTTLVRAISLRVRPKICSAPKIHLHRDPRAHKTSHAWLRAPIADDSARRRCCRRRNHEDSAGQCSSPLRRLSRVRYPTRRT